MKRSGRSHLVVHTSLVVAAVLVGGLALMFGCSKPLPTDNANTQREGPKVDPWEAVGRRLRKETDLSACKSALGQLNNDLAERTDVAGAAALSDEALKSLSAIAPLSRDDAAEIRPAAYTSLDPTYVADCFYLYDAARSLDPSGSPPGDRARVAFAWICRQLYLEPWFLNGQQIPAVPPTFALRRGSGAGLERAYVFLSLLQQMGLDGCLIGSPAAHDQPSGVPSLGKDGKPPAAQKGPFWAVGVRVGADILLFEPWRGEPFPGPDGKGIGTLAQVKANPGQLKAWYEDKAAPWDVKADDVKNATVVLSVPLSALSPRMAMLEQKIKAEMGVTLAIDPVAVRARFAAAAPDGPGLPDVKFWNPEGDQFTYCRSLVGFLPLEDGGLDRSEPNARLYTLYLRSLVPPAIEDLPKGLKLPVIDRLRYVIYSVYSASFFAPPSPRERLQRGRFQDAARDLTQKLQAFGRGQERLRMAEPAEVAEWCELANSVFDNLNQKRYPNIGQTTPQPDTDPDVIEARNAIESFWRNRDGSIRLIVDRATATIGRSEAAFLLALSKHEEAERLQVRAERAGEASATEAATDAWREANNAWNSFLEQAGSTAQTARTTHARSLAARAHTFATGK